jgi:hypothetical protein
LAEKKPFCFSEMTERHSGEDGMNKSRWLTAMSRTGFALCLLISPAIAQEQSRVHPAKESHELYLSFFLFHEDFANWTKTRILADPQHETQILNSSARFLGVAPAEFTTLEAVTVETTARLRTVHTEARAFIAASSKTSATIDHTALAAFENRRRVIVQDGVDQIRRSLSTKSWQGLLGYINDRHRLHVTVSPPGSNE